MVLLSALLVTAGFSVASGWPSVAAEAGVGRPERIVTLAPSLGEIAAEVLGEDLGRIVGVTEYTDYPSALAKATSVGPFDRFSVETVAGLKPDLVLATRDGNPKDRIEQLRELGLKVVVVDTERFEGIVASHEVVGDALGLPTEGARLAARFRDGLLKVRERAARSGGAKQSLLIQVGDSPLVVAGKRSFLNDVVEAVGARNVYSDLDQAYPRPSVEDAIRRNPDLIVVLQMGADVSATERAAASWRRFGSLAAARSGQIHVIDGSVLARPTIRLLEGLARLEKLLRGMGKSVGKER